MWEDIHNKGKDLEDLNYYKAKLNPFNDVQRHENSSDPYDYSVKSRIGKKKYREVKGETAQLTDNEKELQDSHPRQFEIERGSTDNPLHDIREAGRKTRKFFS